MLVNNISVSLKARKMWQKGSLKHRKMLQAVPKKHGKMWQKRSLKHRKMLQAVPKKHGKMWQNWYLKYGKMLQSTLYNSRILLQEVLKYERRLAWVEI